MCIKIQGTYFGHQIKLCYLDLVWTGDSSTALTIFSLVALTHWHYSSSIVPQNCSVFPDSRCYHSTFSSLKQVVAKVKKSDDFKAKISLNKNGKAWYENPQPVKCQGVHSVAPRAASGIPCPSCKANSLGKVSSGPRSSSQKPSAELQLRALQGPLFNPGGPGTAETQPWSPTWTSAAAQWKTISQFGFSSDLLRFLEVSVDALFGIWIMLGHCFCILCQNIHIFGLPKIQPIIRPKGRVALPCAG